jgi:ubiquinol-cytochrome c reductase cytochrome b subunit
VNGVCARWANPSGVAGIDVLLAIAGCAYFLGPFGPAGKPDPTIIQTAPKPDSFFLWLYALLSFCDPPD